MLRYIHIFNYFPVMLTGCTFRCEKLLPYSSPVKIYRQNSHHVKITLIITTEIILMCMYSFPLIKSYILGGKQTGISESDLQTETFLFLIHKPQVKETLTVKSHQEETKSRQILFSLLCKHLHLPSKEKTACYFNRLITVTMFSCLICVVLGGLKIKKLIKLWK